MKGHNLIGLIFGIFGAILSLISIISLIVSGSTLTSSIYDNERDERALKATITFYLTVNLLNFIASLLLIFGALKEQYILIFPWLVNAGFSWCFCALYYYHSVVSETVAYVPLLTQITAILNVLVQLILWYPIYLLYLELKSDDERKYLLSAYNHNSDTTLNVENKARQSDK